MGDFDFCRPLYVFSVVSPISLFAHMNMFATTKEKRVSLIQLATVSEILLLYYFSSSHDLSLVRGEPSTRDGPRADEVTASAI